MMEPLMRSKRISVDLSSLSTPKTIADSTLHRSLETEFIERPDMDRRLNAIWKGEEEVLGRTSWAVRHAEHEHLYKTLDHLKLGRGDTLVDLGIGVCGRILAAGARRGMNAIGLEANPDVISMANESIGFLRDKRFLDPKMISIVQKNYVVDDVTDELVKADAVWNFDPGMPDKEKDILAKRIKDLQVNGRLKPGFAFVAFGERKDSVLAIGLSNAFERQPERMTNQGHTYALVFRSS